MSACVAETTTEPEGTSPTGDTRASDTGTPQTCGVTPPELSVGTGVEAFEPLSDLDAVEVVFGPQGGYHIVAALRACHMSPLLTVHIEMIDEATGATVADVDYLAPTLDEGDCCRSRADMYGYLDVSTVPGIAGQDPGAYLDGKVIAIAIAASDEDGATADASVRAIAEFSSP